MVTGIWALYVLGIIFLILIPFVFYFIKLFGYNKLAWIISILMLTMVLVPAFWYFNQSNLYSKEDALADFRYIGYDPKNDFRIVENSIEGVKNKHQESVFLFDRQDVKRIIQNIQQNPTFKHVDQEMDFRKELGRENSSKIIRTYHIKNKFIVETYDMIDEYELKTTKTVFKTTSDSVFFTKIID